MKCRFLTTLELKYVDGTVWELTQPLRYNSALLGQTVMAPRGFWTDLFSTPVGTHEVFPKSQKGDPASVIHDAAYELKLQNIYGEPMLITKAQADLVFKEALEASGVGKIRRNLMYLAVKLFGRGDFRRMKGVVSV